jgi:hypothetical protein
MNLQNLHWNTIHASAFSEARGLLRWAEANPRPHGALRYRCPVSGSFVLVTEEPTLARLRRGRGRIRCADCGEQHLLTVAAGEPDGVVALGGKP